MSKFYELEDYLKTKEENDFVLTFDEIEEILGFYLPESAYIYDAYWNPSETHTLANLIRDCGYYAKTDRHKLCYNFYWS